MQRTLQELKDLATGIRDEVGINQVTPSRVGNFQLDLLDSVAVIDPTTAPVVFWVDPRSTDGVPNGSDSNTGAGADNALATCYEAYRRALYFMRETTVVELHLLPHPDPDGYPFDDVFPEIRKGRGDRIFGEGVEVVSGPHTITARSGARYTIADSNWTADELVGQFSEVFDSSVPGMRSVLSDPNGEGHRVFVTENNTTQFRTQYEHEAYPSFAILAVGDRIRFCRHAVKINVGPDPTGKARRIYGGINTAINVLEERARVGSFYLRNIELRLPDDVNATYMLSGSFNCVLVSFTSNNSTGIGLEDVAGGFVTFENASLTAGQWIRSNFDPGEYVYGAGVSFHSRDPAKPGPRVWLGKTTADAYLTATNGLIVAEGSWIWHEGGAIAAGDRTVALSTEGGGEYYGAGSVWGPIILKTSLVTQSDFDGYSGGSISLANFIHKGVGAISGIGKSFVGRGRAGSVTLFGSVTIEGSVPDAASGNGNVVWRGGYLELLDGSFPNFGDVTVGLGGYAQDPRINGPWAIEEHVTDPLGGYVGRTI